MSTSTWHLSNGKTNSPDTVLANSTAGTTSLQLERQNSSSSSNNGTNGDISPSSPSQPICQNCSTSTTPLWRRDENGQVLCNACGLFLKLHGRPRPISLKTDIIKSRNRVKTNVFSSSGNGGASGSKSAGSSPAFGASSPSHASSVLNGSNSTSNSTSNSGPSTHPSSANNSASGLSKRKRNNTLGTGKFRSTITPSSRAPSFTNTPGGEPEQQNYYFMRPPQTSTYTHPSSSVSATTSSMPPIQVLNDSPVSTPSIPQRVTSPLLLSTTLNGSKSNGLSGSVSSASSVPAIRSFSSAASESPALAALSAAAQAASDSHSSNVPLHPTLSPILQHHHHHHQQSPIMGAISSSMSTNSPSLNATTTILDQLSAAAAASPYLSPHQPESDTRVPPIASTPRLGYSSGSVSAASITNETSSAARKPPSPSNSVSSLNSDDPRNSNSKTPDTAIIKGESQDDNEDINDTVQQLRTRVTELELVNDLFKSRINELEVSEAAARQCETAFRDSEFLARKYALNLETKVSDLQQQIEKLSSRNSSPVLHRSVSSKLISEDSKPVVLSDCKKVRLSDIM